MASAQDKTALKTAKAISEGKSVKLTSAQRKQVFDQDNKDASALIKAITGLEEKFDKEFPVCAKCDGVEHLSGTTYIVYGKKGKEKRTDAKGLFDKLRVIALALANGGALFLTPNDTLKTALAGAGVSAAGKKKGGSKKKK